MYTCNILDPQNFCLFRENCFLGPRTFFFIPGCFLIFLGFSGFFFFSTHLSAQWTPPVLFEMPKLEILQHKNEMKAWSNHIIWDTKWHSKWLEPQISKSFQNSPLSSPLAFMFQAPITSSSLDHRPVRHRRRVGAGPSGFGVGTWKFWFNPFFFKAHLGSLIAF